MSRGREGGRKGVLVEGGNPNTCGSRYRAWGDCGSGEEGPKGLPVPSGEPGGPNNEGGGEGRGGEAEGGPGSGARVPGHP